MLFGSLLCPCQNGPTVYGRPKPCPKVETKPCQNVVQFDLLVLTRWRETHRYVLFTHTDFTHHNIFFPNVKIFTFPSKMTLRTFSFLPNISKGFKAIYIFRNLFMSLSHDHILDLFPFSSINKLVLGQLLIGELAFTTYSHCSLS